MTTDGWSHLGNHIHLAFSSIYAQVILYGFLGLVGLVLLQFAWKLGLQRNFYSDPVQQKNIVNTQIGYKRSISGMVVYYLWCAFTVLISLTLIVAITLVFERPTGPGFLLSVQRTMFKCSDGGSMASQVRTPTPHELSEGRGNEAVRQEKRRSESQEQTEKRVTEALGAKPEGTEGSKGKDGSTTGTYPDESGVTAGTSTTDESTRPTAAGANSGAAAPAASADETAGEAEKAVTTAGKLGPRTGEVAPVPDTAAATGGTFNEYSVESFLEWDHARDHKNKLTTSANHRLSQAASYWLEWSTDYPFSNMQPKSEWHMQPKSIPWQSSIRKKAEYIFGASDGDRNPLYSHNFNHQFSALEVSMGFSMGVSMLDDWSRLDDFSWPCIGYEMYKPAAANGKLQMGFAFIGYWFLFMALMAGFYSFNLYVLLVYIEVKDLAIADIIGFSEDLAEEVDEDVGGNGALPITDGNVGNGGNSQALLGGLSSSSNKPPPQRKKKKKTADQLLRAKNMQPISYVAVRINTQARANLYKETMRILEPPKPNSEGQERRDSAAMEEPQREATEGVTTLFADGGDGETGGSMFVDNQIEPKRPQFEKKDTVSRYFLYRCLRFTYDTDSGRFIPVKSRLEDFSANDVFNQFFDTQGRMNAKKEKRIGLSTLNYREISTLQQYFGKNTVEPDERKTYLGCFWAELVGSFFYIFQLALMLIYFFLEAIFEAVFYESLFLFAAFIGAYYAYVSWNKILEMSRAVSRVKVLRRNLFNDEIGRPATRDRNGRQSVESVEAEPQFMEIHAEDLLPGDCIEVTEGMTVSCECVLVQGSVLMNEANLTGESTPMEKVPIERVSAIGSGKDMNKRETGPALSLTKDKSSFLFAGTDVISVFRGGEPDKPEHEKLRHLNNRYDPKSSYAIVTGVGTGTQRGDLIRGLFYPQPCQWELHEHVFAARVVMACLWPIALTVLFLVARPLATPARFEAVITVVLTGLTLFSQLIQPIMESMYARCEAHYAHNLEQQGVVCLELQRISMAGRLKVFCFDKTGTLTKEGLDFFGACQLKERSETSKEFAEYREGLRASSPTKEFVIENEEKTVKSEEDVIDEAEALIERTKSSEGEMMTIKQKGSIVNGEGSNVVFRENVFENLYSGPREFNYDLINSKSESLLFGVAACHSLSIDNSGEIIGNPLEQEAVRKIGWRLTKQPFTHYEYSATNRVARPNPQNIIMEGESSFDNVPQRIEILKKWKFDQEKQLQAVLCNRRDVDKPDMHSATLYAKGSVESVLRLLQRGGDSSVAGDKAQLLKDMAAAYSLQGFYVIVLCECEFKVDWNRIEELTFDDILGPDNRPTKFVYTGMLLFKNELRPESRGMIKDLSEAGIESVIITGDSVHTGVAIGELAGVVDTCPYLIDVEDGGVIWKEFGHGAAPGRDLAALVHILQEQNRGRIRGENFVSCAITAAAFDRIRHFPGWEGQMIWYELLPYIHIYGRIKPDGKREVIRMLQEVYTKTVFGMVGDGGNDSGALKQAHVGVALMHGAAGENSDGNVVAPFVATEDKIAKVTDVVREGRACLDTEVSLFYFLMISGTIYGMMLKTWMQGHMAFLVGFQFITLDFVCWLAFPFIMPLQPTRKTLTRQNPSARLASLRSFLLIGSIFLVNCATFVFLGLTQTTMTNEAALPDLSVRRMSAEAQEPSWYSPVSMPKDGLWFLGSVHGRSNNFDSALIFMSMLVRDLTIIVVLANGGRLRNTNPAGAKRRVGGLAESEQRLQLPDGAAATTVGARHERHEEADQTLGGRQTPAGASKESRFSNIDIENPPSDSETERVGQEMVMRSHRRKNGPKFLRNPNSLNIYDTDDEEVSDDDAPSKPERKPQARPRKIGCCEKYFSHPYKRTFLLNWWFMGFLIFDVILALFLSYGHNNVLNYWTTINVDAFGALQPQNPDEFQKFFSRFHGSGRVMKPVHEKDLSMMIKDAKGKVFAADTAAFIASGSAIPHGASGCQDFLDKILQSNEKSLVENSNEHFLDKTDSGSFLPDAKAPASQFQAEFQEQPCGVKIKKSAALVSIEQKEDGIESVSKIDDSKFYTDYARTGAITTKGGTLGLFGKTDYITPFNPGHRGMWCQYICINSWNYRSAPSSFGCKFSYLDRNTMSCYLFQGNFDQYMRLGSTGSGNAEWFKDFHVLNRHMIQGLDKEGVKSTAFTTFEWVVDLFGFVVVLVLVKLLAR